MNDLELLTDAARASADIAMRYWKKSPRAWEKPDGSGPVTEADLAVNAALEARLRTARPGYGWLSEESTRDADRSATETLFIIDPIDGTRAFIAGEATFAISLAVAIRGIVTAAVVMLPAKGRIYSASAETPALRDGMPIAATKTEVPEGARILTTAPNLAPVHWPGGVPELRRSFRPSLAYRLCLVAEGRHDGMITFRDAWEWDIAAGTLIAARAGASVTDRHGDKLTFNSSAAQTPGVVAAPPALHAALLSRMRPAA